MEISVIIPVYNKAEYVGACIRSAMEQDFDSFEVLAVDDGSTDGSSQILDSLAEIYPDLRVIHCVNGGVTAARRIGYEASHGRYVTFADADDKLLPGALRTLHGEIERTGADEVVARYYNQHGVLLGSGQTGQMDTVSMIKELLASRARFCVLWAVIFRRELLEGCLNTPRLVRSGEDILMQIICLKKRPKVVFSPHAVYYYNEGLPNDRRLCLEEQMLYDEILFRLFAADDADGIHDYIVLRQVKMYENFLYEQQYGAWEAYYKTLGRCPRSRALSIADRLALLLPRRIAHLLIRWKKDKDTKQRTEINKTTHQRNTK